MVLLVVLLVLVVECIDSIVLAVVVVVVEVSELCSKLHSWQRCIAIMKKKRRTHNETHNRKIC